MSVSVPYQRMIAPVSLRSGTARVRSHRYFPSRVAAAHFQIERTSRGDRLPPCCHDAVAIVRMNHARPLPAEDLFPGVTHPLEPALGQKLESAIGPGRPDKGRDRLENRPKPLLRVSDRLLGALEIFDVDARAKPPNDVAESSRSGSV